MKICSKCKEAKPLSEFFKRASSSDGKTSACKECNKKKTYAWRSANKEKWNEYVKGEYQNSERRKNKIKRNAELKAAADKYRSENAALINSERAKRNERRPAVIAYRKAFRSTPEYKERARERRRIKHETEPGFRLNRRMSSAIARTLKDGKGGRSWMSLVPYTLDQLHRHIERQFTKGMTWENMGDWHIDHIIPLASFSFETEADADFQAAWAMTNLRPLWAKENIVKHAKILTLL